MKSDPAITNWRPAHALPSALARYLQVSFLQVSTTSIYSDGSGAAYSSSVGSASAGSNAGGAAGAASGGAPGSAGAGSAASKFGAGGGGAAAGAAGSASAGSSAGGTAGAAGGGASGFAYGRNVAGASRESAHGEVRALDIHLSLDRPGQKLIADRLYQILIETAYQAGIDNVIWNKKIWSRARGQHPYRGKNPHIHYIHIEFTRPESQLTVWQILNLKVAQPRTR